MKRTMTTLAAFVCCVMMMANPVDPAAARQAAARFLQAKGAELNNEAMQAPRRAMGQAADGQEASPYYVFNATGKKGFVVVSGDDCVGDNLVLGYTDHGSFDADNVPVNMQDWLDGMAKQITYLSRLGVTARRIALHDAVAPLLTSTWGQGKTTFDPTQPYNALCPKVDGLLSYTGCMATALSQVLYYYRWPQEPIVGDLPGYQTYTTKTDIEPLPSVKFDWDNMLDNYNNETTEAQQMAVATLMRYCGQVLQMDYTPSASNAYSYDIDVLVRKFGIDQGARLLRGDEYSISDWDNLLYTELTEKRPVLHGGFTIDGGHAFVLDGYDVQDGVGYYHVNWGWGGGSDGFYRIDVLNPDASGTGGSSTSDGYNLYQNTVIGIQPAKSAPEHYGRYLVTLEWNISYQDKPYHFSAFNSSYMPAIYAIAVAERRADGTIDYDNILCEKTMEIEGYSYAGLQTDEQVSIRKINMLDYIPENLAPGSHRLVFINKEVGTDAPWRPIFGSNCSMEVTIGDDGKQTNFIVHPNPVLTTTDSSIKVTGLNGMDEMKMLGLQHTIEATITNNSDDAFTAPLWCILYRVENQELAAELKFYEPGLFIEANSNVDIQFNIYPPAMGDFVLVFIKEYQELTGWKLSDIKNAPGYIGQKELTVKDLTFYIQNFTFKETTTQSGEPQTTFNFTVDNKTPMDYSTYILIKLYKRDSNKKYQPFIFNNGNDYKAYRVDVKANQQYNRDTNLGQKLEPGDYGVCFFMASDYIGNKLSDFFQFAGFTFTIPEATGINAIDGDQPTDTGSWFSLDGRRLDSRPTAKGVYVHQGKKFVVR